MTDAPPFVDDIAALTDDEPTVTPVGRETVAVDFRLPVAPDAPFSSSLEYDQEDDEITGAALRFSPDLLERFSDDEIEERLQHLLDRTDPPAGTIWTVYARGDQPTTGPHILAPGGFSEIEPAAFVAWLERLLRAYEQVVPMPSDQPDRGSPDPPTDVMAEARGNTTLAVFPDGSIRFAPPFTKDQAGYVTPDDPSFDATHDRCADCVHFIPGEGCHFVQGRIDGNAYCSEFYADFGAFAHDHGDHVEVNAELVGPEMAFDEADIADFVDEIEERLQQRRREREGSRVEGY